MSQNTILIGIGYAGCKILDKANTEITKLYLDTDPEVEEKYSSGVKEKVSLTENIRAMRIGEKVCGKYPAMGDRELAEKAVKESKSEILKELEGFNRIILVTSLGGGTSNGVTKKLAKICKGVLKKEVIVVTGLPFELEGHRTASAQYVLQSLQNVCEVKYVQYDSRWIDKSMSVCEAFNICDEKVLQLLYLVIKSRI